MASDMPLVHKIYWLIEDCKRYGTLPFAGLARAGFIAVQFLNSLVEIGILTTHEKERFLKSIQTVSSRMSVDLVQLERSVFLEIYGHLRPGTYDILSPRYDEQPELYFSDQHVESAAAEQDVFKVSISQLKAVDQLLEASGLTVNAIELFTFIEQAIILREKAKFEFTKNLSNILTLVGQMGEDYGMSLDALSYVNIEAIKQLYSTVSDPAAVITASIAEGKQNNLRESRVVLPPLITQAREVWQFFLPDVAPNYVTQKSAEGPIVDCTDKDNIHGAIVCIPSADPGYDWLFSYPIAGFITAWGGINSHMSIRASEQGMPAIIGAGEKIFDKIKSAQYVRIDCAAQCYEIIR